MAAKFRRDLRVFPGHDNAGGLHGELEDQIRGYRNTDPPPDHQKAATPRLIRLINSSAVGEIGKAIADLITGAYFFACRPCEYSSTPQREEKRTKIIIVKNVRFFRGGSEISHDRPTVQSADFVCVTFEDQKNRRKLQTRTQRRNGQPVLCPVLAWSKIIKRVRGLPGSTDDSPVCSVSQSSTTIGLIRSHQVQQAIRMAGRLIGQASLGFNYSRLGCYSIRCGAAMALYLSDNSSPDRIRILGRWNSDSWMKHIREQVEQAHSTLSVDMVQNDDFFDVSHAASDPPTRHSSFTMDRELGGPTFSSCGLLPTFNLDTSDKW